MKYKIKNMKMKIRRKKKKNEKKKIICINLKEKSQKNNYIKI